MEAANRLGCNHASAEMTHVGMMYEKIPTGGIFVHQEPYCKALRPIEFDKARDEAVDCTPAEHNLFRVGMGFS